MKFFKEQRNYSIKAIIENNKGGMLLDRRK